MAIVEMSTQLQNAAKCAIKDGESCAFSAKCIIHNPNSGYSIETQWIRQFKIEQIFAVEKADPEAGKAAEITDKSQITVAVPPNDYMKIIEQMQDLECTVILSPYNVETRQRDFNKDTITLNYVTMVGDSQQTDIVKAVNIKGLGNVDNGEIEPNNADVQDKNMDITIFLQSKFIYNLRHKKFNSIFKDVKIEDVVHWLAERSGFKEVNMVPPKDDMKYDNLIIPPMLSLAQCLQMMQDRYGVYGKGIGYFFTEDSINVYPLFERTTEGSPVVSQIHLIRIPPGQMSGGSSDFQKVDNDYYIVTRSSSTPKPLNTVGAENIGTTYVTTNADDIRDRMIEKTQEGKVVKDADKTTTVVQAQNTAGNARSDALNVEYGGETSNPHIGASKMIAADGTAMSAAWEKAQPGILAAGQLLNFHYDGMSMEYHVTPGVLMGAKYVGVPAFNMQQDCVLVFNAELSFNLEPDKQSDPSYQTYDS